MQWRIISWTEGFYVLASYVHIVSYVFFGRGPKPFNYVHVPIQGSAGFSTTSAQGEISTAPPNCNSNPYEKR